MPPPIVSGSCALLRAGRDVEIHDLIGAGGFVALREHDRIADVAEGLELHAFHDAAALHVETDDHPPRHHRITIARHPWC
jgi:hypothetical protein